MFKLQNNKLVRSFLSFYDGKRWRKYKPSTITLGFWYTGRKYLNLLAKLYDLFITLAIEQEQGPIGIYKEIVFPAFL